MKKIISFQLLLFLSMSAFSQKKDNVELQKMYDEDQSSRSVPTIDWKILSRQDSIRQHKTHQLISDKKIITAKDCYNSAMIFQHGRDTLASAMAVKQMRKAIELDSTINKWLLAAAIDRDLMRRGKPQIYGTQYIKNKGEAKWSRYKIDSTQVSDQERKRYRVETLAEQKIKEHNMNLLSILPYYSKYNSIDKVVDLIKSEKEKGSNADYNVSENEVNGFGYELMNNNKTEEALRIFKLNTELYPNGYNAFDSYGECLLKLNKKEEGLKAYRKSLELNPKNENARAILNKTK
jgi:tetratricopeptide (TPR) repeat protein